MNSTTLPELLTDEEQGRFADLIYAATGIRIPPQKKTLLSNRLRRRLRTLGLERFDKYLEYLTSLPRADTEWDAFLQAITTHETYLFRDPKQWDWFRDTYLARRKRIAGIDHSSRRLRVWSAACSTGDEAYTIACCIADRIPDPSGWQVEVVGTDIGQDAIDRATEGVFGERAMRLLPDSYRRRFFEPKPGGCWRAKASIRHSVRFKKHNLMEPMPGAPFDIVFLKNVLIYFDPDSRRRVFGHVDAAIRRGGMLVAGVAEGIGDLARAYQRVEPWLYAKLEGGQETKRERPDGGSG